MIYKEFLIRRCALGLLIVCGFTTGCAVQKEQQQALLELSAQVATLQDSLTTTQSSIEDLNTKLASQNVQADSHFEELNEAVVQIPSAVSASCPVPTTTVTTQCDTDQRVQTVIMSGDKIVVGELERVWIDPPGVQLTARIDTGATSSSLHSGDLTEFERDGEDWVRFTLRVGDEDVVIEREVLRFVRVFQQADREGSRRPVITMRVLVGNIQEDYEFTLADRSHLEYQMLLGRNFLTDIALVDVGHQFVQPPRKTIVR